MGYAIGTVTSGGGGGNANHGMLDVIVTLATANGWTTQRYVNTGTEREWIGKSLGLSGTEEIFIGFKTFQDIPGDWYNLKCATFIGYISGNSFETQPGIKITTCPSHNNSVTYFVTANAQRIVGCLKVGTPVYEHFYCGKFFPYAKPGEYPSPLICAAMFDGESTQRYSNTTQEFPYPGNYYDADTNLWIREQGGNWVEVTCHPFMNRNVTANALAGPQTSNCMVPADAGADAYYQVEPIVMMELSVNTTPINIYGELDGVFFISGFNNGVENVVQVGGTPVDQTGMTVLQAVDAIIAASGRAFVMCQNVYRTTWRDFVGLEMS